MGSMKRAISTLWNLRYGTYVIYLITYLIRYRYVIRYVMNPNPNLITYPNPYLNLR